METTASRSQEIRNAQREVLFPCTKPLYSEPLVLTEGQGLRVRDADGIEYLDFFSGILTTSLGHCHPTVNERVQRQMDRLGHTSTLYVTEPQIAAARRLTGITPGELNSVYFTNSGTEAVETAITLAQLYTGGREVIALRHAYSGRSAMASGLTGHASWRPAPVASEVRHAMSPNRYRAPFEGSDEELTELFAADVEEVIRTTTTGRPAAFFAETIQGVGGYIVPPKGYFQRVAEIIRSYGGLLICDEVQAGLGRTGKWFAIEHWGVEPDIIVMAKGIANGFPVGATVTRPEIAAAWTAKTISTFGGNPISMAATDATLEVMAAEDVCSRSSALGGRLRAGLDDLATSFDWIGEVRGLGLMLAMELVEDRETKVPSSAHSVALLEATREERLLVGLAGLDNNIVRIAPAMLISEAEVDEGLACLRRACRKVDDRL